MEAERGKSITILAGRLFDPYRKDFRSNQVIQVSQDKGLITSVRSATEKEFEALRAKTGERALIDLSSITVLPGFVDTHVHRESHPFSRFVNLVSYVLRQTLTSF